MTSIQMWSLVQPRSSDVLCMVSSHCFIGAQGPWWFPCPCPVLFLFPFSHIFLSVVSFHGFQMHHSDLSHQDSVLRLVCLGNSFPCFQRSTTASFRRRPLTHCPPDLGVGSRVCVCLCRAFTLQHHALLFAHCHPVSVNSVFNSMPVTLLVPQKCLFEWNHFYMRPLNEPEQRSLVPCCR